MIHTTSIILGPKYYLYIKSIKICMDMLLRKKCLRKKCLGVGVIDLHLNTFWNELPILLSASLS